MNKQHQSRADRDGARRVERGRSVSARLLRDERASGLALAAVVFGGLVTLLALAIDLGFIAEARAQAQRTADAAALAGVAALIDLGNAPGVEDRAFDYASAYTTENPVRGAVASVEPADVVVDLANWTVTVTVNRTAARANPVDTLFGPIIGIDTVDVTAVATAEAVEAGAAICLLPLALPDKWLDMDGDGLWTDGVDQYAPWPDVNFTGYSHENIGDIIVIKPFKTTGQLNPSWYYPWRPPGQSGGNDYRNNIANCVDPTLIYELGDVVDTEPGAMIGPTKQGFGDLIAQDPTAMWDTNLECITHNDSICSGSPRARPMPMFDVRVAPDPGAKPFTFTNFANVFVEGIVGNEVHARFMGLAGVAPGGGGGAGGGPTVAIRIARLIQ